MSTALLQSESKSQIREEFEHIERRRAKQFVATLQQYDPSDKASFRDIIGCAERLGIRRKEVAECLNATQATISRWIAGKTAPPLYSREAIAKRLSDLIQDKFGC